MRLKIKTFLAGILLIVILAPAAVYAVEAREEGVYIGALSYEAEEPVFFITTARLNLRPSPCTSQTRLALVPQGRRVEVLDFRCGEWYEVYYKGMNGFMYATYLREISALGTVTVGTVELLEWSEARNVMTLGTVATLIDIRSGFYWEIASFSNGNHADVEPITAEDTTIMLQAFGGRWTWTPRPVLVLINGRTIAASINGMPHGGSTRNNGMNGHICLHFLGSTTHRSAPQHVRDHQNAVIEAYNTASSWHSIG